jgi:hypothetical protein
VTGGNIPPQRASVAFQLDKESEPGKLAAIGLALKLFSDQKEPGLGSFMVKRWQKVILAAGFISIALGWLGLINWKLLVWSTPGPDAHLKSSLPLTILIIGCLASASLTLMVCLAHLVSVQKRTLAAAQRDLRQEMETRKKVELEMERLIQDLEEALAHIKTLSGLLPICARCKKIRDDKGYWSQMETYITQHSSAQFTHSLCPDCAVKTLREAGIEASASAFQSAGPPDPAHSGAPDTQSSK